MSRHVCETGGSSCQKPVCIWNEGPLGIFLILKELVAWQQEFDPWRGPYSTEEQGSLSTVWCLSSRYLDSSASWTAWNIYMIILQRMGSVNVESEKKCLFLQHRSKRQFFWFYLTDWHKNMRKVSFPSPQTFLWFLHMVMSPKHS